MRTAVFTTPIYLDPRLSIGTVVVARKKKRYLCTYSLKCTHHLLVQFASPTNGRANCHRSILDLVKNFQKPHSYSGM